MPRNELLNVRLTILFILLTLSSCGQKRTDTVNENNKHRPKEQEPNKILKRLKMTEMEKEILIDFHSKRKLFDKYIKDNSLKLFTCPGCGYPTLTDRGSYDICDVCNWEDDNQDDNEADKIWGGPNGNLSLTENRINIGKKLIHYSDSLKSKINLDPSYVFKTIEFYKNKKEKIGNRMTGNETLEHPIWVEWNKVETDLQIALCRDKTN